MLHNATKTGLASQNRSGRPNFEARVRGQIGFIHMVNPDQARSLREQFDAITS
jgi:hypothetical protein